MNYERISLLQQRDKLAAGPAHHTVQPDHIPVLPLVEDGEAGAVVGLGQHGGGGGGLIPDIQVAPGDVHHGGAGGLGIQEGQAEVFRQGEDNVAGNGVQIVLHPGGVVRVVVIAQLQEHRGGPHPPHLADGGGGFRPDLVGQGVDGFQAVGNELGGPLALCGAGVVIDQDAPGLAVLLLWGGVGVEGQVEIVVSGVGGPDGGQGGHVRRVAGEADAGGGKVGLHGVCQAVHPLLFRAAVDVQIVLLGRGGEIDDGHKNDLLFSMLCGKEGLCPCGSTR